MGPIPPKIVDAWHTKPPTLFLETNVFPARLPGMLSLDLATFERQPWPTPRVDTLDLSHCWEGKNIFLKLSGWGPLTITHDLLTILELLDVPFGSFTSLKDAFGTSHSRLLTITHDYSRFLFCSVFDLTLQCVVTMRAQSFVLMCHMKTHSSCTPCLNKFEKQSPLLVQHVTRKIPHPLMSKSAINLSSQALPEPGRPRSCFRLFFQELPQRLQVRVLPIMWRQQVVLAAAGGLASGLILSPYDVEYRIPQLCLSSDRGAPNFVFHSKNETFGAPAILRHSHLWCRDMHMW